VHKLNVRSKQRILQPQRRQRKDLLLHEVLPVLGQNPVRDGLDEGRPFARGGLLERRPEELVVKQACRGGRYPRGGADRRECGGQRRCCWCGESARGGLLLVCQMSKCQWMGSLSQANGFFLVFLVMSALACDSGQGVGHAEEVRGWRLG
jgi:hypothetical protein